MSFEDSRRELNQAILELNQTIHTKQLAATITAGIVSPGTPPKEAVRLFWEVFGELDVSNENDT